MAERESATVSGDEEIEVDADLGDLSPSDGVPGPRRRRRRTATGNRWMRIVHVYTSMISLLVVLFFGVTGLTLNHPEWTFGDDVEVSAVSGSVPPGAVDGTNVDFLAVSEYARNDLGVHGAVADYGVVGSTGTISFKSPGYAADVVFDIETGTLTANIEQQGWVAVLNDVHKGRDTDSSWDWVIDASAILLVVVALTGLGIQFLQRKRRRSAMVTAVALSIITVVLVVIAIP